MSDELPEGWIAAKLPDVFDVNPPKPRADALAANEPVSFVPMGAVDADRGAIVTAEEKAFAAVRKGYTAFANGDVIMAKITPCFENGKAALASGLRNGLGFGSSEFHVFRSRGGVIPEYLLHFIRQEGFRDEAAEFMTGTAGQARVPVDYMREVSLPIPPLSEQRRMVEKAEALFEQLNRAKGRLDRVPLILKRFRQAVLAAACLGKLTEEWRALHGELKETWPGQSPSSRPDWLGELPEQWFVRHLEDISDRVSVGHVGPTSRFYCAREVGVPFVRSQNVRPERLVLDHAQYVTRAFHDSLRKSQLKPGDILVVRVGANRGDVCVVPEGLGELNCANIVFARPQPGLSAWIGLYANSPEGQKQLREMTTGSAQGVLNTGAVAKLIVPLPPPRERAEIAKRVTVLTEIAETIERRIRTATAQVGTLPQAILSKAFSGDLVPTEAELARQEGRAYEPASLLLQRLGQQSAIPTSGRRKGRTGRAIKSASRASL
jgi:type I restriction enzyme S subunit